MLQSSSPNRRLTRQPKVTLRGKLISLEESKILEFDRHVKGKEFISVLTLEQSVSHS